MIRPITHVSHGTYKNGELSLTIYNDIRHSEIQDAVQSIVDEGRLPSGRKYKTFNVHLVDETYIVKVTCFGEDDYSIDVMAVNDDI